MVLGTAGYLSPEQAQGAPTTPASDRYALAATAFELLAGERLFENDSATAEAAAHVNARPPSLCALRPELPCELDDVFARALAKDPGTRFATCGEFASALRETFSGAAGPTRVLTAMLPVKATRRLSWLAVMLAAAAAAGMAVAAVLDSGGGGKTWTVVERVTVPATTIRETVTQPTTAGAAHQPPPPTVDGHALNDQGYAKLQQGDFGRAVPLLQQAVAVLRGAGPADPYEAYANFNLGVALGRLGRCSDAAPYIATADRLEPGNKDVRRALKAVDRCLGRAGRHGGGGNNEGH